MREDHHIKNVPSAWLHANFDRVLTCHEKLRDRMWILRGGYADDWAWGDAPDPVSNPSMPWVRPDIRDFAVRLFVFESRPELIAELFRKRRSWRTVSQDGDGFRGIPCHPRHVDLVSYKEDVK